VRWLIRRVLKKGKGSVSYEEDVHYGDVLTIGRAADQAIFLPDMRAALNHARVTLLASNEYKIESLILAGIRVNGSISYVTTAGVGTVVEVGDTRLTLLAAPQDFEGAVEVSTLDKREQQAEKQKRSKPTRLSQTGISKRRPSWILFVTILAFGLILPMIGHFVPGFGRMLKHSPLPSTSSWNPGPLEAAHQYFGDECTKCHQYAFLTVRDKACLSCHKDTPAHADPAKFNLPQLGNAQCRSCHKDHEGLSGLIRKDQRLCSDCHRDLKARTQGASKLADVADFGTSHPQFRVELPAWTPAGKFSPKLVTLAPDIKENSGLIFSHVKHLNPDGLNTPDGHRVLKCANCHIPDAGGANMRPINFESMCHDCHKLGFDALAPKREVPHGKVAAVIGEKIAIIAGWAMRRRPARSGSNPLMY